MPCVVPEVTHIARLGAGSAVIATRNVVVPYMSMTSPGEVAPTLIASAQASVLPATTGVHLDAAELLSGGGRHGAGDVAGPGQRRQLQPRRDLLGQGRCQSRLLVS